MIHATAFGMDGVSLAIPFKRERKKQNAPG
jgi:hypothetical protein